MNKKLELALYTCWGIFTTGVNFAVIYLLRDAYGMATLNANIIAWLVANYIMYVGIRRTVFHSKVNGIKDYIAQLNYYYISRIITLALEEMILWKLVEVDGQPMIYVKIFTTVLAGVLNYLFSKAIIFHCEEEKTKAQTRRNNNKIKEERGYLV